MCLSVNFFSIKHFSETTAPTKDLEIWYKCLVILVVLLERGLAYSCLFFHFLSFFFSLQYFFSIKHFSGTTAPRILKFGTNVGCDRWYCGKEPVLLQFSLPFICPVFFLSIQDSDMDLSGTSTSRVLKLGTHVLYDTLHYNLFITQLVIRQFWI